MSEPRLSPDHEGVWIPLRLYEAMAHAYYGHGPRHQPLSHQLEATYEDLSLPQGYEPVEQGTVAGGDIGQAATQSKEVKTIGPPMGLTPITDIAKKTYLPERRGSTTDGS